MYNLRDLIEKEYWLDILLVEHGFLLTSLDTFSIETTSPKVLRAIKIFRYFKLKEFNIKLRFDIYNYHIEIDLIGEGLDKLTVFNVNQCKILSYNIATLYEIDINSLTYSKTPIK